MTSVDIVIVNWNAGTLLRDCVQSVTGHGSDYLGRVVIVDNGSVDGSLDLLPEDARFKVIRTGRNLGFGRACNIGATETSAPYLLFLNPDAALYPDTLAKALAFMERPDSADIGVCGIRLNEDGGSVQRHTTRFPSPLTIYATGLFRNRFDHLSSREVDHVIGAFYLIRRNVFTELSGFDERFFVYFEDLDLSLRVRRSGRRIFYLADAQAYHRGGGTSDQVKARRLFFSMRSRILYARKNFSPLGAAVVIAGTVALEPILRGIRAVLRGSVEQLQETAQAYRLLWGEHGPFRRSAPSNTPSE